MARNFYSTMSARNKNARLVERSVTSNALEVETQYRDEGTLEARAGVRFRTDTIEGASLTGLSVKTAGGRNVRFSGSEARTLYRLLRKALGHSSF